MVCDLFCFKEHHIISGVHVVLKAMDNKKAKEDIEKTLVAQPKEVLWLFAAKSKTVSALAEAPFQKVVFGKFTKGTNMMGAMRGPEEPEFLNIFLKDNIKDENPAYVLAHELGHFVDCTAKEKGFISDSPEFRAIAKHVRKHFSKEIPEYFLSIDKELFAYLWTDYSHVLKRELPCLILREYVMEHTLLDYKYYQIIEQTLRSIRDDYNLFKKVV